MAARTGLVRRSDARGHSGGVRVRAVAAGRGPQDGRGVRRRPGGERHESLRCGARIEIGLRQFLEAGDFGAFTTDFEDLGGLRQLPRLAVQNLMADGHGFGGEGDWKTAALLRILKVIAGDAPGGTSFMEVGRTENPNKS